MLYSVIAYGHPNISSSHKTTIEFTKDKEITKKASCIIGVKADFDTKKLKKINNKIKIIIKVNNLTEEINCKINPSFSDKNELIIRKSDFICKRTFGIKADKASCDLNKKLIEKIKNKNQKILVEFYKI